MNTSLPAQQIAATLRDHEATLRRLGLKSLALFGSSARAEHRPASDLDMLYEFEEGAATLDHFLDLQAFLEDLLGRPVDLVPRKYLSPILRRSIQDDVMPVYEAAGPS